MAGKNGLALLRDLMLFVLVVLLLLFPDKLNDILTRSGFDEGSIVGFKWKAKLIDSDLALKEARVLRRKTGCDLETGRERFKAIGRLRQEHGNAKRR